MTATELSAPPVDLGHEVEPRWRPVARRARALASRRGPAAYATDLVMAQHERALLQAARGGHDVCWHGDSADADALVSIVIATRGGGGERLARMVRSALRQTHRRLEVVVVGDHAAGCPGDDTAALLNAFGDDRVVFHDLAVPTDYPSDPRARWHVMAHAPRNAGLALARGAWIATADDDDELTSDHVEVLLRAAREQRAELVHSRTLLELGDGRTAVIGRPELTAGQASHGSLLFARALAGVRYSHTCHELGIPGDWDLLRRMVRAGARVGYADAITYRYWPSPASLGEWRRRAAR